MRSRIWNTAESRREESTAGVPQDALARASCPILDFGVKGAAHDARQRPILDPPPQATAHGRGRRGAPGFLKSNPMQSRILRVHALFHSIKIPLSQQILSDTVVRFRRSV